jgi:hypothetical protein
LRYVNFFLILVLKIISTIQLRLNVYPESASEVHVALQDLATNVIMELDYGALLDHRQHVNVQHRAQQRLLLEVSLKKKKKVCCLLF